MWHARLKCTPLPPPHSLQLELPSYTTQPRLPSPLPDCRTLVTVSVTTLAHCSFGARRPNQHLALILNHSQLQACSRPPFAWSVVNHAPTPHHQVLTDGLWWCGVVPRVACCVSCSGVCVCVCGCVAVWLCVCHRAMTPAARASATPIVVHLDASQCMCFSSS